MQQPGLDNRHRDKNGEISRKHGNTLIRTLRETYGPGFAPDCDPNAKLADCLIRSTRSRYRSWSTDSEKADRRSGCRGPCSVCKGQPSRERRRPAAVTGQGGSRMSEPAKVFEDRSTSGQWRVEWFDDGGGCEVELFSGPTARQDALRYGISGKLS